MIELPWSSPWFIGLLSLAAIYGMTTLSTMVLLVLENRRPTKTLAWILVLTFIPVAGMIFYAFLGRNYRKHKIFSRKGVHDLQQIEQLARKKISPNVDPEALDRSLVEQHQALITLLISNNKSFLTYNNRLSILLNGGPTFDAILEAMRGAEHHIHMEYYILTDDSIGRKFQQLLIEKASQGVEVRLVYDSVGSWRLSNGYIRELRQAGAEVQSFMPVYFPMFASKANYRNHRKIVVVDGKTGFLGGVNIADHYASGTPELGDWRDTHLQLEGASVHCLQTVFLTDWYFASNQLITDSAYFPAHGAFSSQLVQITASGPDSDWASIMQAYFAAINSARSHVYISTPYFIPNESISTALKTAALSGIDVRILLPANSDYHVLKWSSYSYFEEFFDAGVRIFLYQPGFTHSKLLMVDSQVASVGTANMDVRSFDQNFEVNALIYNQQLAEELEQQFLDDLQHSREIIPEDFQKRPKIERFKESVARLLSPLL